MSSLLSPTDGKSGSVPIIMKKPIHLLLVVAMITIAACNRPGGVDGFTWGMTLDQSRVVAPDLVSSVVDLSPTRKTTGRDVRWLDLPTRQVFQFDDGGLVAIIRVLENGPRDICVRAQATTAGGGWELVMEDRKPEGDFLRWGLVDGNTRSILECNASADPPEAKLTHGRRDWMDR